jgi:hypothetical protein
MELFDYLEVFYKQRRRHSTLGQIFQSARRTTFASSRAARQAGIQQAAADVIVNNAITPT